MRKYWLIIGVGIGDIGVFLAFVILGEAEHGITLSRSFFRTALPFSIAWFVISPWLGGYSTSTLYNLRKTIETIPVIWLVVGIVAFLARAILTDRPLILAFAIIAIAVQGIALVGWRCVFVTIIKSLVPTTPKI